jgi:hypothetical protein
MCPFAESGRVSDEVADVRSLKSFLGVCNMVLDRIG